MPTVSVKLADEVKARIDDAASSRGITPHAFMVEAIEQSVQHDEKNRSFIDDALTAREAMVRSGKVYDGDDVAQYLRAKLAGKPVKRPAARKLASYARRRST